MTFKKSTLIYYCGKAVDNHSEIEARSCLENKENDDKLDKKKKYDKAVCCEKHDGIMSDVEICNASFMCTKCNKLKELQERLNKAFANDKTHVSKLSQNN